MTFSDGTITAFDARSAERELWSNREPGSGVARVLVMGGDVFVMRYPAASGMAVFAKHGIVESLSLRSGRSVHRLAVHAERGLGGDVYSVDATRIYLTGTTCSGKLCVQAIDRSSGQQLWSTEVHAGTIGPAVPVGEFLFVWDGLGAVLALDSATGRRRWRMNVAAQ